MFKDIGDLKELKTEEEKVKLKVIAGILNNALSKEPKLVSKLLNSNIGVKLLSFLPKLNQEDGDLVLKLINHNSEFIWQFIFKKDRNHHR